jgi:hypothetical protein
VLCGNDHQTYHTKCSTYRIGENTVYRIYITLMLGMR